ncbi:PP2C family protein-serine/threonine phosphatase [Streptomyces viridochromogenes]|uniref:Putative Magnesium or manganese-dependent protein phosphatase n=1 Tax=Streptomyces viridochromogenes Tue57 TaxID=1160705 RepID=L8P6T4_STRVR|nr:PP2C family protein-serine/threonine phosphatase [Streptomyces viridochromogenes]ELS51889.1 putative Magnesium or manganese-dependent protein phosphatase [Streptomyces viridochromogenes Tue57]
MFRIKARVPRKVLAMGLPTAWGAMAITYKLVCPLAQQDSIGARVVTGAVFFAVGTGLIVHVRQALLRELRQVREVAGAAQSALIRPLPARIDGLNVAAAQLSADRSACVGGDLYEVIATEHGVRAVMGDVRGHGIAALSTVAAVLGSFREAVHDEPDLVRVLRRLDRALARHLRERARAEHPASGLEPDTPVAEEFVTVLLLEIGQDGEVTALNCGHPWPYLLSGTSVAPLARADPLPPLGPFPLPTDLTPLRCGSLLPGDSLVLYTDGVEDARDARGRFFSLQGALIGAVRDHPVTPQTILRTLFTALIRHTRGEQADDIALLVLRNDRTRLRCSQPLGARGTARPATHDPQPTNHL